MLGMMSVLVLPLEQEEPAQNPIAPNWKIATGDVTVGAVTTNIRTWSSLATSESDRARVPTFAVVEAVEAVEVVVLWPRTSSIGAPLIS